MKIKRFSYLLILGLLITACNFNDSSDNIGESSSLFSSASEIISSNNSSDELPLSSFDVSISSESVSSSSIVVYEKLPPTKLFDIDLDPDSWPSEEGESIILTEFENKEITYNSKLHLYLDEKRLGIFRSAFLYDVDNDGYRDLCTTISNGSGVISWSAQVFSIAKNEQIFFIHDRLEYDYFFNIKDDVLVLQRCKPYNSKTLNVLYEGVFEFNKDTKTLDVNWSEK